MPTDEFGRDFYIWRDGQRLRVRMIRTVQPAPNETNAAFERRMDRLVERLAGMDDTQSVAYDFERRDGIIVLCTIDLTQEPRPVAVIEDDRPAGGRPGGGRGGRGGRNNN